MDSTRSATSSPINHETQVWLEEGKKKTKIRAGVDALIGAAEKVMVGVERELKGLFRAIHSDPPFEYPNLKEARRSATEIIHRHMGDRPTTGHDGRARAAEKDLHERIAYVSKEIERTHKGDSLYLEDNGLLSAYADRLALHVSRSSVQSVKHMKLIDAMGKGECLDYRVQAKNDFIEINRRIAALEPRTGNHFYKPRELEKALREKEMRKLTYISDIPSDCPVHLPPQETLKACLPKPEALGIGLISGVTHRLEGQLADDSDIQKSIAITAEYYMELHLKSCGAQYEAEVLSQSK